MVWPPPTIEAPPGEPEGGGAPSTVVVPAVSDPAAHVAAAEPTPARASNVPPVVSEWQRNPQSLLGSVLAERYRVHALIGRGPMGIVAQAAVVDSGKPVAIKLLPRPAEHAPERFAWLVREATALAHFDHPSVEPVFDFGSLPDGSMFLVRNQTSGVPLRLMLRQGRLPGLRALTLARQIAVALASAHAHEIVHGRLKPENVIVIPVPEGDQVRLIDFGMSSLGGSAPGAALSEDARLLALRTRLYWPAEYDGNTPAGPHIDLYSLGVLLFEMIAGQPPFLYDTAELGSQPPRRPPSFAECTPPVPVPKAVEELVQALLDPAMAERGATLDQVVEALDSLLAGRVPSQPPPTPQQQHSVSPEPETATVAAVAPPPLAAAAGAPPLPLEPAGLTPLQIEAEYITPLPPEPESAAPLPEAAPAYPVAAPLGAPAPAYMTPLPLPPEYITPVPPAPASSRLPLNTPRTVSRPPVPPSRRRASSDPRLNAPAASSLPPPMSQSFAPGPPSGVGAPFFPPQPSAQQQPAPQQPAPQQQLAPQQPAPQQPAPQQPAPQQQLAQQQPPLYAARQQPAEYAPPAAPFSGQPPGFAAPHAAVARLAPGSAAPRPPPSRRSVPPPYPQPPAAPPSAPSGPADEPDPDEPNFRGGTWSKLKGLVGRKKPDGF